MVICFFTGETPAKQAVKDSGIAIESLGINIVGLAVSWENRDAYYVSFTHEQPKGEFTLNKLHVQYMENFGVFVCGFMPI